MPFGGLLNRGTVAFLMGGVGSSQEEGANEVTKVEGRLMQNGQYDNNETVYCKNNVCVHRRSQHNRGYLTITAKVFVEQHTASKRPALLLTWIPNSTLVSSYTCSSTSSQSQNSLDSLSSGSIESSVNPFLDASSTSPSSSVSDSNDDADQSTTKIQLNIAEPDVGISVPPPPDGSLTSSPSRVNTNSENETLISSCKCQRFSVDLSEMRSLKLLFSDGTYTCGHLVVASRESQYKILHFHHGGLDHLAQVLHQWHSLLHTTSFKSSTTNGLSPDNPYLYRHFLVCRPEVTNVELHPEEGLVPQLDVAHFQNQFNLLGQLEDDVSLRRQVFFGGVEHVLRPQVWPLLLGVFPFNSTGRERLQMANARRDEYNKINVRRVALTGVHLERFRRCIQTVVDKDVVRTDRTKAFYAGDDNPHVETMRRILLNFAVYNPGFGYTQGMSDLLAPVLCELEDEVAAFWCFVGVMQRAAFVATPTDRDMDRSLRYLRDLVRLMAPEFHQHLERHRDANEMLFCHRWILLCFKREFPEPVALRMWEACWANYLTDFFHLFLCLAIICVYADAVIAQDLSADEMLLHFSSLAMYMDGDVILRKARGLLYQFRQLREIPCSLAGLCTKCGPGIWDSTHIPRIFCMGHSGSVNCKYAV